MVDLNLSARAYDWVLKVVRTIAIWPPPTKTPATTFPRRFNTDHWTGSYQREDESLDRAGACTTLAFQEKMSISYALTLLCVELSSARENHVFILKAFLFVFLIVVVFVFVIVVVIVSLPLAFGSSPLEEGLFSHLAGTMIFPEQFMLVVAAAPVAICPLIVALRSLRSKVKTALVSKLLAVFNQDWATALKRTKTRRRVVGQSFGERLGKQVMSAPLRSDPNTFRSSWNIPWEVTLPVRYFVFR